MLHRSGSGSALLCRSNSGTSLFSSSSPSSSLRASSMGRALKRFSSSVSGEKHAHNDQDVLQEEVGEWKYLVVDTGGIRPREDASYSDDTKGRGADQRCRLQEGTIVSIDRRRSAGWTTWLGLASGDGWVFDVSPKDKRVRMVEAEVTSGEWVYVAGREIVPIISLPSPQQAFAAARAFRRKKFISPGQTITVVKKIRPVTMKTSFLMLADGIGWTVDHVEGRQVLLHSGSPCSPAVAMAEDSAEIVPELGSWSYIVVDPKGQTLRNEPSYNPKAKIAARLEDGDVVTVFERRPGDGTTFLRIASPSGWVFDCQPGSKGRVRLTPVSLEHGEWFYSVSAQKGIALRSKCSFGDECRVGAGPLKGCLVQITERIKVGETTFLRISNGHWIFDRKCGRQLAEGPLQYQRPGSSTMGTVQSHAGVTLLSSPTSQRWASTRLLLLPGSRVHVLALCEVEGLWWTHVSKGQQSAERGGSAMEGWLVSRQVQVDQPEATPSPHASSFNADAAAATRRCFSAEEVQAASSAPNPAYS